MIWALRRYRHFEAPLRLWRLPAGLFEDPAFSVGMGGWRFWGAMNLSLAIEYAVQTGWTRIFIFGWPFPLTGL